MSGSYTEVETFKKLGEHLNELGLKDHIFYTSTPPGTYEAIVENLGNAGLNKAEGSARLVIEKPFGHDLESAKKLNDIVQANFEETQIYRIDHYLAKETAQNIAALRFANTIFEPTWSAQYVDHVQVTMAEPIGIGGRGSFYEDAGVIRDVFQNHLLQLVALTATEPPSRYDAKSVRDEKVKVFQAMSCVNPSQAIIGQYGGNSEAKSVPAGRGRGERFPPRHLRRRRTPHRKLALGERPLFCAFAANVSNPNRARLSWSTSVRRTFPST